MKTINEILKSATIVARFELLTKKLQRKGFFERAFKIDVDNPCKVGGLAEDGFMLLDITGKRTDYVMKYTHILMEIREKQQNNTGLKEIATYMYLEAFI